MKFGFNMLLWTAFVTEEHASIFAMLREIGYDGVELPVGDGPVSHYRELASVIRDHGLETTAVAMGLPDADPSSPDPKIRAAGLDRLKSRIECAHAIGAHVLAGPLYTAHKFFREEPVTDDDRARAADTIAEAMPDAEAADVTLCLEVLNRFEVALVNTTEHARQICARVEHPRLRIHYDTHHAHIEETSHKEALEIAAPYLGHLHVSESHRGALGSGLVDWDAATAAVRDTGYDAWCTVEAFSCKVEVMRHAANVHRDTFDSQDQVARDALPFLRGRFA